MLSKGKFLYKENSIFINQPQSSLAGAVLLNSVFSNDKYIVEENFILFQSGTILTGIRFLKTQAFLSCQQYSNVCL